MNGGGSPCYQARMRATWTVWTLGGALGIAGCGGTGTENDAGLEPVGDTAVLTDARAVDAPSHDASLASDAAAPDAGAHEWVHGVAQKGPFLPGSRVVVAELDTALRSTGVTYTTETFGPLGEFETRALEGSLYQVDVTGPVVHEYNVGDVEPVILRAIVAPDVRSSVAGSVTVITHLTTPRLRVLVAEGMALEAARLQAETELRTTLGVVASGFDPGPIGSQSFVPNDGTDAAAFVALVSLVADCLHPRVLTLDALADDLRDGALAPSVGEAARLCAVSGLYEALVTAWSTEGYPGTPPDFRAFLDSDGDGTTDALDNCPVNANADQRDGDGDGDGDVCDARVSTFGSCTDGVVASTLEGVEYCVPRCGSPVCASDSVCVFLSRPGLDDSWRGSCLERCDPGATDPCPIGHACQGTVDPVIAHVCVPDPVFPIVGTRACLVEACTNLRSSEACLCHDGERCVDGECREVCALGGSCGAGSCEPVSTPPSGAPLPAGEGACSITALDDCAPCTADAQCRVGLTCAAVDPAHGVAGTYCLPLPHAPDGSCPRPFGERVVGTSASGAAVTYCRSRVTTCEAISGFLSGADGGCTAGMGSNDACGAPGIDDGICGPAGVRAGGCTFACSSAEDCFLHHDCVGGQCDTM